MLDPKTLSSRSGKISRLIRLLVSLAAAWPTAPAAADEILAASLLARPSDTVDSREERLSDDGRYVVFESASAHQVVGQVDTNDTYDVFLFDQLDNTLTLLSHVPGQLGTAGNAVSRLPTISRDGALVAFQSLATDLWTGTDANDAFDVFLYDVAQGTLRLLSHAWDDPDTSADAASDKPVLSGDGSTLVFSSDASDLLPGFVDANGGGEDLFRKALPGGQPLLVSHALDSPTTTGNSGSLLPRSGLSLDGATIAFTSFATDLVAGSDGNGMGDAYLFSLAGGAITLLSHVPGAPGTTGDDGSTAAGVSDDGAWVVFESLASDLTTGSDILGPDTDVFLFSRASGEVTLISHLPGDPETAGNAASNDPRISGDGGRVVFTSAATDLAAGVSDTNGSDDVFLFARDSGEVTLLSHAFGDATTAADGGSASGRISRLGGFAVFDSSASDLSDVAGPPSASEVFRYSLTDQSVQLISRAAGLATAFGNDMSRNCAISADGERILLRSQASDLVADLATDRNFALYLHHAAAAASTAVSVTDPGSPVRTADDFTDLENYLSRSLSAGGHYLVFESLSPDLVPGQVDDNGTFDVFLFDRVAGTTTLVSHVPGQPLVTGSGASDDPMISSDGGAVAFLSRAPELLPIPPDDRVHVFHWARSTGAVTHLSDIPGSTVDAVDAAISGDGGSVAFVKDGVRHVRVVSGEMTVLAAGGRYPSLSHDGLDVVFETPLSLVPEDTNFNDDIYHVALDPPVARGVTVALLSRTPAGLAGNGDSEFPVISDDGEFAVFDSVASDLVADDSPFSRDVFHAALAAPALTLVSHRPGAPTSATGGSFRPVISAGGQAVAFTSTSSELVTGFVGGGANIYHFDLPSGTVILASHAFDNPLASGSDDSSRPAISADGGAIAFESLASNLVDGFVDASSFLKDVYRFDLPGAAVELVSHTLSDPVRGGNGESDDAGISADGTVVAFVSRAEDLVVGDDETQGFDVYLHAASLAADLVLDAGDLQDPVPSGEPITYLVDVLNDGPGTAPQPRIHLIPPAGALLLSVDGPGWVCAELRQSLRCDGPPLAPQAGAGTLTVRILPPPGRCDPVATVHVGSAAADPLTGDNTLEIPTLVTGCATIFEDGFESGDTSSWSSTTAP